MRRAGLGVRRSSIPLILLVIATAGLILFGSRAVQLPPRSASYAFGHGPTIVLVHGLGSRIGHWLPTARILARHHRVVLVDLPGHGDTEMPQPFSLEQAEVALDRALAAERGGPVVLVGHSVGGLVAAAEAIDHPARVRALVLVEAPLRQDLDAQARAEMLSALDHDYSQMIREAYESFGRDSTQGKALWQEASQFDSVNMRQWIRMAISTDLSGRAAALRMPVLAVMAERSWPKDQAWPAVRDVMGYAQIANLTPLRLEGCGHFVMLDRPAALAEAIERFADGAGAQPVAAR
jgi:pimeloyl-ACP methyl ester carboxylesterase